MAGAHDGFAQAGLGALGAGVLGVDEQGVDVGGALVAAVGEVGGDERGGVFGQGHGFVGFEVEDLEGVEVEGGVPVGASLPGDAEVAGVRVGGGAAGGWEMDGVAVGGGGAAGYPAEAGGLAREVDGQGGRGGVLDGGGGAELVAAAGGQLAEQAGGGAGAQGLHLPAQQVAAEEQGGLEGAEAYEGVGLVGGGVDAVTAQVEGEPGGEGAGVAGAALGGVVAGWEAAGQPRLGEVEFAVVDLADGGEGVAGQLAAAGGEEDREVVQRQDGAGSLGPRGLGVGAQTAGQGARGRRELAQEGAEVDALEAVSGVAEGAQGCGDVGVVLGGRPDQPHRG
ncbi:hypothetical protein, partial [Streptomyces sp. NPDC059003]|uniref:hypothetical protein n=1 Tax=Streptomyces sp. NPDC059003 TaxID=3346691 RepID=UPI0036739337